MGKKVATRRWWNYQLVKLKDEEGNDCHVLYEIFWKQEGIKKAKVWMYQDVSLAGETPEDVVELLAKIAEDLKGLEVITEKQLPSDSESEKEYAKILTETDEDDTDSCTEDCCSTKKKKK